MSIFEDEFGWVPSNIVDACDLMERYENVNASIAGIASVVVGSYCRRGRNFSSYSIPSHVTLRHLAIDAALVYRFCVEALGLSGSDMRKMDPNDRRSRKRGQGREEEPRVKARRY